jgi:hypothetical protein
MAVTRTTHSPFYRHWLSVDEFTGRFGPPEGDCQALQDFLTSHKIKGRFNFFAVKAINSWRRRILPISNDPQPAILDISENQPVDLFLWINFCWLQKGSVIFALVGALNALLELHEAHYSIVQLFGYRLVFSGKMGGEEHRPLKRGTNLGILIKFL